MPVPHTSQADSRQDWRIVPLWVLLALLPTWSAQSLAQAGSRPVQYFDVRQSFLHALNGSGPMMVDNRSNQPMAPVELLELPPGEQFVLWVELAQGRLNLLENLGEAGVVLRKRMPISIGKQGIGKRKEGDNKTPVGIYRLHDFLADTEIDDFYGIAAWPLDYPNALDQIEGRTGHGIWLHGLPKFAVQRPFLASEGCVVLDNDSLAALADEIGGGVMVVLSPRELRWAPISQQQAQRQSLQKAILAWEQAWESRDSERYLQFYADDFTDLARNKTAWSDYKRKVNAGKSFIDVTLKDISVMVEPDRQDIINVSFKQVYNSDNYQWRGGKQQLWRWTDDSWQIIYEGDYQ